ncbi:uncharacterized transcriptional regulatory protein YxjL [Arthrobacter sp. Hiyo4]|nr:uncharacterized transcriptional regulatory protein YxjL [Arthrobacter sp. Hiyo4]
MAPPSWSGKVPTAPVRCLANCRGPAGLPWRTCGESWAYFGTVPAARRHGKPPASGDSLAKLPEGFRTAGLPLQYSHFKPDVVLMDVRMPVLDGIEATRAITASGSFARIIILTTFDVDEYAFAGLQAGASAFLLKDVAPSDLVNAVRVVASGDAVVAPRVTQRLLETYVRGAAVPAPSAAPRDSLLEDLTPRETEMLEAMAEGLSNAEIAHRYFLSEATVKTHVRRILTKLHLRDRVLAVVYAYETGLVVPSNPDY